MLRTLVTVGVVGSDLLPTDMIFA